MSSPHSGHLSQDKGHKYLIRVRYGSVFQHLNNVLSQLICDKVTYWTVWGQLKIDIFIIIANIIMITIIYQTSSAQKNHLEHN